MTFRITAAIGCVLGMVSLCSAQPGRYPTVIGPSGAPYGPTQAEYQYRQRYGHASPEFMAGGIGTGYVNGYPGVPNGGYGHGGYGNGYGGYGNGYGYGGAQAYFGFDLTPYAYPSPNYTYYPSTAYYGVAYPYGPFAPQPFLGPAAPAVIQGGVNDLNGFNNGMMNPALVPNALGASAPNGFSPLQRETVIHPSPLDAQQRSLQYQVQGDELLKQLSYPAAADRYRKAIDEARDRAEPRIRMGLTYAARSRYLEAAEQFQLSTALDPNWPRAYESLDSLIGERNTLEKNRIKQRVAEWTLQDARDPVRLFLLGVLMYLDGDQRAREMFNTAQLLSGPQPHLTAFLNVADGPAPQGNQAQGNQAPANNAPAGNNAPQAKFAPPAPTLNVPPPTNDLPASPADIPQLAIPPLPE